MASYRIAAPDEYLAITGMNVKSGEWLPSPALSKADTR